MAKHADSIGTELIRPAKRPQPQRAAKRRKVAGPWRAFGGSRTLGQALEQAVARPRRREIGQQSK